MVGNSDSGGIGGSNGGGKRPRSESPDDGRSAKRQRGETEPAPGSPHEAGADETDYGSDFDEETLAALDAALHDVDDQSVSDSESSVSDLKIVIPQPLKPVPVLRPRTPGRPAGGGAGDEEKWRQEHEGLLFLPIRATKEERRAGRPVERRILTSDQYRSLYNTHPKASDAALVRTEEGDYLPNPDHGEGGQAVKESRAEMKSHAVGEVQMFVRDHGRFRRISPEMTLLMDGIEDWTRTYGLKNIWLKTRGGDFLTVENLHAKYLGRDGADEAYFRVNVRPLRRDLAQVFVQDGPDTYSSLAKHCRHLSPGDGRVHPATLARYLSGRDARVLSPDGWALMTPLTLEKFGWNPYFQAAAGHPDVGKALRGTELIANGAPVSKLRQGSGPSIILALDKDTLISGRKARDHVRANGLPPLSNIFYRTQSSFGEGGNFSCAATPRELYGTPVKPDHVLIAELDLAPKSRAAGARGPGNNSRGPSGAPRTAAGTGQGAGVARLDERSRERGERSYGD
jgi:hypothetical protein